MRMGRLLLAAFVGVAALSNGRASADHIPGHNNGDPVFPVPFPDQNDWSGNGEIIFLTLIGPDGGDTIYNTEVDITYVSDGVTPPEDLIIVAELFVDGVQRQFDMTGAQLGFGSGPGTYQAKFDTDLFNGVVDGGIPGPGSVVNMQIGSTTGAVNGTAYFVDSFLNFTVQQPVGPVPTMSEWGLVLMSFLMLGGGIFVLRRRNAQHA
ncbi:MAG: hypothetical protein ACI8QZ_002707 [Chlamydiales bacterium]|jgi:hypothetical protein